MQRCGAVLLIGVMSGVASTRTTAQESPKPPPAPPTCAVVPVDWAGLGAIPALDLLEVGLSQTGMLRLVERERVRAVLDENLLRAALGAEGLMARRTVGELLRADLLVIVGEAHPSDPTPGRDDAAVRSAGDSADSDVRGLSLTIAETRGGLRLLCDDFIWDPAEPEASVGEMIAAVLAARSAYESGVNAVVAIPPFECDDVSLDYTHLMSAYAALAGQAATARSGTLLVELTEARALAKELAASRGDDRGRREFPFYLLGRYANKRRGLQRTVSLHIELLQADRKLGTFARDDLAPETVPDAIRTAIVELLHQRDWAASRPAQRNAEALLLRNRGDRFFTLGYWTEALAMYEASLFLAPDQPDLHCRAVTVCDKLIQVCCGFYGDPATFRKNRLRGLAYARVGLAHFEVCLRHTLPDEATEYYEYPRAHCLQFLSPLLERLPQSKTGETSELLLARDEVANEYTRIILSLLQDRANAGTLTYGTAYALSRMLFLSHVEYPAGDKTDALYRAIQTIQHLPRVQRIIEDCVPGELDLISSDLETLLGRLGQLSSPGVHEGVRNVRHEIEKEWEFHTTSRPPSSRSAAKPEDRRIQFVPLNLALDGRPGSWFPCGEGVDAVVMLKRVYLMRAPGQLDLVYETHERRFNIWGACFDGRYVWAPVARPEPLVLVIDPGTGHVSSITAEDGLPSADDLVAAPVGPGCLCVCGLFGRQQQALRSWLGLVTFEEGGTRTVEIIHESRQQSESLALKQGQPEDVDVAIPPSRMFVLDGIESPDDKLILLLGGFGHGPFLIDPKRRSLTRVSPFGADRPECAAARNGFLYWCSWIDSGRYLALRRARPPSFEREELARFQAKFPGPMVFVGDTLHLQASGWHMAEPPYTQVARLDASVPGSSIANRICDSNHYGVLLVADRVYQVEPADDAKQEGVP